MKRLPKTLKQLEKAFGEWDDGYYDLQPRAFRRFSKGLYNLMSFAVATVEAYEVAKKQNPEVRIKGDIVVGSLTSAVIDTYFKPRLFELGYLGAWAAFETYLRDVAWLKLSKESKPMANEIIDRMRHMRDVSRVYKHLLNTDLQRIPDAEALLRGRNRRNKLAHSGKAVGYGACFEMDEYWQSSTTYAATEKGVMTEELFCKTLSRMWNVGDILRKKHLKMKQPLAE